MNRRVQCIELIFTSSNAANGCGPLYVLHILCMQYVLIQVQFCHLAALFTSLQFALVLALLCVIRHYVVHGA